MAPLRLASDSSAYRDSTGEGGKLGLDGHDLIASCGADSVRGAQPSGAADITARAGMKVLGPPLAQSDPES
jgi:hypothetical protein